MFSSISLGLITRRYSVVPPERVLADISRQHLAKACCEMSQGRCDRSLARSASAVWTFSCASSDRPTGEQKTAQGLQPWERRAQGNRPERAAEWRCSKRIYMLLYIMTQSLSHLIVQVFSTKIRGALLHSEEIRSETFGNNDRHSAALAGRFLLGTFSQG